MYMMLLMLLIGMMCRWKPKQSFGGIGLYPRKEVDLSLESYHWLGEGAMEAP